MSAGLGRPTAHERKHYDQLVGCTVVRVLWEAFEGSPLLVLLVSTPGGGIAQVSVMCDPEGNAPGFLDIQGVGA